MASFGHPVVSAKPSVRFLSLAAVLAHELVHSFDYMLKVKEGKSWPPSPVSIGFDQTPEDVCGEVGYFWEKQFLGGVMINIHGPYCQSDEKQDNPFAIQRFAREHGEYWLFSVDQESIRSIAQFGKCINPPDQLLSSTFPS